MSAVSPTVVVDELALIVIVVPLAAVTVVPFGKLAQSFNTCPTTIPSMSVAETLVMVLTPSEGFPVTRRTPMPWDRCVAVDRSPHSPGTRKTNDCRSRSTMPRTEPPTVHTSHRLGGGKEARSARIWPAFVYS